MPTSLKEGLEVIRSALLELKATGERGFEGLISVALEAITGISFRLASSGYQGGVDGKAAFEGNVAFEGKLYKGKVQRTEVISKIADFARKNNHSDLVWVLGATCSVSSQLAENLRADGAEKGISVCILDWVPSDFPRLAVALAVGGSKVEAFLKDNCDSVNKSGRIKKAFAAIRADAEFAPKEKAIREALDVPGIATATAKKANDKWFAETLADRGKARKRLGQPLALKDATLKVLERNDLVNSLSPSFNESSNKNVICVHGEEGCGKSWVVVQSWLVQSDKPLFVFLTPDDFSEGATEEYIEKRVIAKLIAQTGDIESKETEERWRRRLRAWKDGDMPLRPRLLLFIDGINQRPDLKWGKIIDNIVTYVSERGGRLIFTVRTHYFKTRVKVALSSGCTEISVPQWSPNERDKILTHHHISSSRLSSAVAKFLRNPRILWIALKVLGEGIAALEELNIERLLFAHIMEGVKQDFGDDPYKMIEHLQMQAKELGNRVTIQDADDLYLFKSDVAAVAEGRFYKEVPGEVQKFQLREEGVSLALGLGLLENLRKAERNDRNISDTLKQVLGPIEAMDKTAEAVAAAFTVAAADNNECSSDIACALIMGFAELQNPPSNSFAALSSFARVRPRELCKTVEALSLGGGQQPNFYWIQAALVRVAESNTVWSSIKEEVQRWLRLYSLNPQRRMFLHIHDDSSEKIEQEYAKQKAEIEAKLAELSPVERAIKDRLQETEGDLDMLSRLAITLLAGKELELFADLLVDWLFASTLNSSYQTPTKDFLSLVSLNRKDWQRTRHALLRASEKLSSKTGKWARLRVLCATGDPEDDREASSLYDELRKDSWRSFDKKESIEPSDPSAAAPSDLHKKLRRYENFDASALLLGRGQTPQDHLFFDERPVIARFALDVAVTKHREFADDVVKRVGLSLRQGLLELRNHVSLITRDQALAFNVKWNEALVAGHTDGLSEGESIILQYALLIAFPHLSATQQIKTILATTEKQPLLLELFKQLKTPCEETLDHFTNEVVAVEDHYKQHLLLEIAAATGAKLTSQIRALARTAICSPLERLRISAFHLVARSGDSALLKAIAESDWKSEQSKDNDSYESWYGSLSLLEAAKAGLVDQSTILGRISPRLYWHAALMLESTLVQQIARRVEASIHQVTRMPDQLIAPEIELEAESSASIEPTRFSITERESQASSVEEFFKRLQEGETDFRRVQQQGYDSFMDFRGKLTTARANIVLDRITQDQFAALIAAEPEMAHHYYDIFVEMNDEKLPAVHNLILLLASAIADTHPQKSADLLERVSQNRPLVRFTFGESGVDLHSICAWTGSSSPALDLIRRRRLDMAISDQAIAVEVFSALQRDHDQFLRNYVEEQLAHSVPAERARGIMVTGFSDQNLHNDQILEKCKNAGGIVGKAYEAAIKAYRSNGWARHWYKLMCETEDSTVFWQAGVLFTKCVDGRFSVWQGEFKKTGKLFATFSTSLHNLLRWRHKDLKKEREKKLFGQEAPSPIFVR